MKAQFVLDPLSASAFVVLASSLHYFCAQVEYLNDSLAELARPAEVTWVAPEQRKELVWLTEAEKDRCFPIK